MRRTIWVLILIILIVIVLIIIFRNPRGGLNEGVGTNNTPENVTGNENSGNNSSSQEQTKTVAFTVSGGNFYFTPNTLKVKEGDTVTITFKNSGGMHNLKIDEFNVATPVIQSGAEDKVTFIANKKGSFEYYCSVGNHRQMGMKGTLTVE